MSHGGEHARYSDGLVIQEVADFQNGSQFRVIAPGVQADIYCPTSFPVPAELSAREHRRIAHNGNGALQRGNPVYPIDGRYGRANWAGDVSSRRSKDASRADQIV